MISLDYIRGVNAARELLIKEAKKLFKEKRVKDALALLRVSIKLGKVIIND